MYIIIIHASDTLSSSTLPSFYQIKRFWNSLESKYHSGCCWFYFRFFCMNDFCDRVCGTRLKYKIILMLILSFLKHRARAITITTTQRKILNSIRVKRRRTKLGQC